MHVHRFRVISALCPSPLPVSTICLAQTQGVRIRMRLPSDRIGRHMAGSCRPHPALPIRVTEECVRTLTCRFSCPKMRCRSLDLPLLVWVLRLRHRSHVCIPSCPGHLRAIRTWFPRIPLGDSGR